MGAWLAFLKSKLLLPTDNSDISDELNDMSDLLEFQLKRLEAMQNASRLLFDRFQLGVHFFKRGDPEIFNINQKIEYNINLFDIINVYGKIFSKESSQTLTIASSKLYAVEEALERLSNLVKTSSGWRNLFDYLPDNIKDRLEHRSAIASHFVASLELVKEGKLFLRQDDEDNQIYVSLKS